MPNVIYLSSSYAKEITICGKIKPHSHSIVRSVLSGFMLTISSIVPAIIWNTFLRFERMHEWMKCVFTQHFPKHFFAPQRPPSSREPQGVSYWQHSNMKMLHLIYVNINSFFSSFSLSFFTLKPRTKWFFKYELHSDANKWFTMSK